MSNQAGKGGSGSGRRGGSRQGRGRGPNAGSVRSRGETRAAKAAPWKLTESYLPKFAPGALDAAAIVKSVNDALLPVVEKELNEAAESMKFALTELETEADLLPSLQEELMRRYLPQFTEAVRKGVLESIRTRQMHLAQLAVLHRHALASKTLMSALTRIDHEVAKAGVQIIGDTDDQSLFHVVEDQPGVVQRGPVTFELITPAYVDKESGKLIERGWLRAVAEVPPARRSREDTTPGQKRRANHAKANKAQVERAPAQPKKKPYHRGQDPHQTTTRKGTR
jgi:hypothetical protein